MARSPQKRGEETRERILAAAAQEFAAKGFEGGSMRAVARACGIELALVQYHFSDKLNLWRMVLERVVGGFEAALTETLDSAASLRPAEQLALYLEALIRRAAHDPVFVGIMSHARIYSEPGTDAFRERMGKSTHRLIEIVRAAQLDGEWLKGEPVVVFYVMVGAALRIFMVAAIVPDLSNGKKTVDQLVDEHVRVCMALFSPATAQASLA